MITPYPGLLPREAVSQRLKIGLSSRTNVRDLRFLPAVEMTEGPTGAMFPVLRHSLRRERNEVRVPNFITLTVTLSRKRRENTGLELRSVSERLVGSELDRHFLRYRAT